MDYDSCDIVAIDSDSDPGTSHSQENYNNKPLVQLLQRLTSNDIKQNTILTNEQIVEILNKEFKINIYNHHELEVEIFLNVMKKYLKDWPRWEDLDKSINCLKVKSDTHGIEQLILKEHNNLKAYLQNILETTKPMIHDIMKKFDERQPPTESKSDVVLEVHATRAQLNTLFLRYPEEYKLFNIEKRQQNINLDTLTLKAIFNWWSVSICIRSGSSTFYKRQTQHNLSHMLVNKKLNTPPQPATELHQKLQVAITGPKKYCSKTSFLQCIEKIKDSNKYNFGLNQFLNLIQDDFKDVDETLIMSAKYRQNLNKYPYKRYLNSDMGTNTGKYDLHLEETVTPMREFQLGTPELFDHVLTSGKGFTKFSIELECPSCDIVFDRVNDIKMHYDLIHVPEPDLYCTNCNKQFSMITLSENRWSHQC